MLDLTFGEQVKIILRRKGMTIKELAAIIEEKTGKKMSRQNLTQRLGRDNFQEQDMRMIAEILGCQFRLSILDDSISAEKKFNPTTEKEKEKEENVNDFERDITIGELVDIHQELDELEEESRVLEPIRALKSEAVEEEVAEKYPEEEYVEEEYPQEEYVEEEYPQEEYYEEEYVEKEYPEEEYYEEEYAEQEYEAEPASVEDILREMEELERESKGYSAAKAAKEKEEPEKKAHGWKSYLQFRRKKEQEEVVKQEPKVEEVIEVDEEPALYLEDDADLGDEGLAEADENEPVVGDVNPYTGREYESNSVRIHPKRIGYVQVYDRGEHKWTDMTEWAFLGYQERKKALLGKDYEPPIYLD